tara:strand:- start:1421 stop:2266 length:846 start_codon:yes stop_codon:yes gene_type:complete
MNGLNNERTYGVEVEFISNEWGQRELADKINSRSSDIPMPRLYIASYSDTDSSKWRLKTDSSVSSRRGRGLELVSPILRGDNDMLILKNFMTMLNELHCDVNRTCGLHVHVGARDWGVKEFKNLAKRYAKFESAIDTIMPNSRRLSNNSYCRSNANYRDSNLQVVFAGINKCKTARDVMNHVQGGRYYKLNLESFWKHGTVEFRHHSGTICPAKIENWVMVCMGMTKLADTNRSVKITEGDTTASYQDKLSSLMNGLVKTGLVSSATRRFYTKRARALCTS